MPQYVEALAKLEEAKVRSFQQDIAGTPSQWVVTIRAAIRPVGTIVALLALILFPVFEIPLDEQTRISLMSVVGLWFGTRIHLPQGKAQSPFDNSFGSLARSHFTK